MSKKFAPKFCLLTLSPGLAAASLLGWALPSTASPQLLFNTVETNGSLNACLSRAQAAIAEADLLPLAPTALSISGSNENLTVTVYCETPTAQMFQATIMLAGERDSAIAKLSKVMGTVNTVLREGSVTADLAPVDLVGSTMTTAEFEQFMLTLEESWPDYLDFIAQPVASNYFTAMQAAAIVSTMRFGEDEVQAAMMLYPRVVDLQNWYLVEQAITFDSDRLQLRQQIAAL